MSLKSIELEYWKVRGLGSAIAHFLSYANVPFNYNEYTDPAKWGKRKAELLGGDYPLANLPMITDPNNKDKHLAESNAILLYVALRYKAEAGPTMEELPDFMCSLGSVKDLQMAVVMPGYLCSTIEAFKEKIEAAKTKHSTKMNHIEASFKNNNWIFGNRATYIDFIISDTTERLIAMEKELKIQFFSESQRPVFTAHMERINSFEGVKQWRASDKFNARPFNAPQYSIWN